MNFFKCCKQAESGSGFLVSTRHRKNKKETKFYKSSSDINRGAINSENTSIVKINKSQYDQIWDKYAKKGSKWTDNSFPPSDKSLGPFQDMGSGKWRRISEIVSEPVMFENSIAPGDVLQSENSDQVFLASVAALAENAERVHDLFGNQDYNDFGIYKIMLRVNSQIEEILIDDYVPVNEDGFPIFAKPNKSEIWVMLLQKARAKVYGSYANMVHSEQNPREILQQMTHAPTEKFNISEGVDEAELSKTWRTVLDNSELKRPIVVKTHSSEHVNWKTAELSKNSYYSLLDSVSLRNSLGNEYRLVKLRNASGLNEWKGAASEKDTIFWDQIEYSENRTKFLSEHPLDNQGIFYMQFADFVKYFEEVYINFYEENGSYINEYLFFDQKRALMHELEVFHSGFYTISVEQKMDHLQDGYGRTTLMILKKFKHDYQYEYELTDGTIKYNEGLTLLKSHLPAGKYIIYSKIESTLEKHHFPHQSNLILYSKNIIRLTPVSQTQNFECLKKAFLNYGRGHKRQLYNNDLMWMSWKLVNQGGFGYLAFGNSKESQEKFVVTFNEQDFVDQGFTMKKPFKRQGANQVIEVLPGDERVLVVRVTNSNNKKVKFPPKVDLKILPASETVHNRESRISEKYKGDNEDQGSRNLEKEIYDSKLNRSSIRRPIEEGNRSYL